MQGDLEKKQVSVFRFTDKSCGDPNGEYQTSIKRTCSFKQKYFPSIIIFNNTIMNSSLVVLLVLSAYACICLADIPSASPVYKISNYANELVLTAGNSTIGCMIYLRSSFLPLFSPTPSHAYVLFLTFSFSWSLS
jgi:hypothetical protein